MITPAATESSTTSFSFHLCGISTKNGITNLSTVTAMIVLDHVGSSDMSMSKLARVNVSANVTMKMAEILRLLLVSAGSRVSSCFVEFLTNCQEKKDQSARNRRFRMTKKLEERYPP